MGLFDDEKAENRYENQLEVYQEILDTQQAELEQLEGVEGSTQIEARKEQLTAEMQQTVIQMEQTAEQAEQANIQGKNIEPDDDFFFD